jgi:hypothetical protein
MRPPSTLNARRRLGLAAGKLNLPAKDGEPTLLLLLDSGASVNVAGRHWERFLDVIPGVGTDVTAVGGGRVRSLGQGKLEIVFAVGSAQGIAHVLAAPLMNHHKPHKLHYLAASYLSATPKRLRELVAPAYATVAGGSQVAYHDPNAAQALLSPPDAAASAWGSFFQGRGVAGAHGSGDAAWSSYVLVDEEEAPTVATAARKAAAAPYPGNRSSKAAAAPATTGAINVKPKVTFVDEEAPTAATAAPPRKSLLGQTPPPWKTDVLIPPPTPPPPSPQKQNAPPSNLLYFFIGSIRQRTVPSLHFATYSKKFIGGYIVIIN